MNDICVTLTNSLTEVGREALEPSGKHLIEVKSGIDIAARDWSILKSRSTLFNRCQTLHVPWDPKREPNHPQDWNPQESYSRTTPSSRTRGKVSMVRRGSDPATSEDLPTFLTQP